MRYDAFISYRHGGLDGQVAERLHKMLETFRVPVAIARKTGKKRIARVFRDREELPTSSDLSGSIEEALRESEFLVLICSKRTCQSRWVLREVDRFIELGRRDRIITILVDGEPAEAFPEQLRWRETDYGREELEPLAADIRADTPEKSLKLLKSEVLRVLAPILGCAYDDLRQRHRERVLRRLLAGVCALLAGVAAFSAYSSVQLMRINEQMRMKLYNQSFVLAESSAAALQGGDPVTAALLALEGLPKRPGGTERPYVAAAEKALAAAIGAYEYRDTYVPHRNVFLPAKPAFAELSPDETYLALLLRDHTLLLLDTMEGSEVFSRTTAAGQGKGAVFPSPDVMVYLDEGGLTAVSIPSGETLWKKEVAFSLAMSADASTIAAVCEGYILLLDPSGGEKARFAVPGRSVRLAPHDFPPRYDCLELCEDGSLLAVNFTDGSVSVFRAADGREVRLFADAAHVTCSFSKERIAFAWLSLPPETAYTAQAEESFMAVYDRSTLERLWDKRCETTPLAVAVGGNIAFVRDRRLVTYGPDDRRGTTVAVFGDFVTALKEKDGGLLAGLGDGTVDFRTLELGEPHLDGVAYGGMFPSNVLALGERFAVAGAAAAERLRILKMNGKKADAVYPHAVLYAHSNARGSHVYAHYIDAILALDAKTGAAALTVRAEPGALADTNFIVDEASGNVVREDSAGCTLYSVTNGTLLFRTDRQCGLTETALSVFGEGETIAVNAATGREEARYPLPENAVKATLYGDWLVGDDDEEGLFALHTKTGALRRFPKSELLAAFSAPGNLLLCMYGGGAVRVHSMRDDAEIFRQDSPQEAPGVFFMGDGALLALTYQTRPSRAYVLPGGEAAADLSLPGHSLMGVFMLEAPGLFLTTYIEPLSGKALGLVRNLETLEVAAEIPGCHGGLDGKRLLLAGERNIKAVPLLSSTAIRTMAEEFIAGRSLTPEQRKRYHVVE